MSSKIARLKNIMRFKLSAVALCALGGSLLPVGAYANHAVVIYFDGAWCQKTAGQGTDTVSVAANETVYPPSGFFDPNDSKDSLTVTILLGTYNDRGGGSHQEMRKTGLIGYTFAPGQSADVVVAMYGSSNGGFFAHLANALKSTGPTIVGAVVAVYGSPPAGVLVKAVSEKTVAGVSDAFRSADPGTYVGDISIHIQDDQNDHVSVAMAPNTNAKDRHHVNPPMNSESFQLNGPRAEYWPKLAVVVH